MGQINGRGGGVGDISEERLFIFTVGKKYTTFNSLFRCLSQGFPQRICKSLPKFS